MNMLFIYFLLCICGAVTANVHSTDHRFTSLTSLSKNPELVRKYGYPLEEHNVTTKDGYILTMHRIPHGKDSYAQINESRPVVFVMHGILMSSADWVLTGPGKGLAYILAEEGFDVWLGNARGNHYSRRHLVHSPDSGSAFWQFSWDEIGHYDLPAMIDYALEKTGRTQLHYIGFSQGSTTFFVMGALRPEYNQKIISMNALAPVAYMAHSGCPLMRAMAPFSRVIKILLQLIGMDEILPNNQLMKMAGEKLCRNQAMTQEVCGNILFLLGGWNSQQVNRTILPAILSHTPAGGSIRQLVHYGQNIAGKEFRRFDHGFLLNYPIYGTLQPPLYLLSQVKAPVYVYYSLADPLTHKKDVKRLWKELGNPIKKKVVPMSSFSHLDFAWGIDAKTLVYDDVIGVIKSYKNN